MHWLRIVKNKKFPLNLWLCPFKIEFQCVCGTAATSSDDSVVVMLSTVQQNNSIMQKPTKQTKTKQTNKQTKKVTVHKTIYTKQIIIRSLW
jgi:hypothetical protein